ncbi:MAG: NAD(P)/FAD-dependent oxidoreductase [Solirubrobacteraceae bacterium]
MSHDRDTRHVVIVGGGFAGLGCAQRLAEHDDVHVTLIDRNNYHQFQPLLYQVATAQLAPSDIAHSLRSVFADQKNVDVKLAEISAVDPEARAVTSTDGQRWDADVLVLAAGSQPNFFGTPGAPESSFPLYSLDDATRLRSRILGIFEQVDRDPKLIERGALNFVIVGGGPTGVEVAGAIADMLSGDGSGRLPGPRRRRGAGSPARLRRRAAQAFLRQGPRLCRQGARGERVKIHLGTGVKAVGTGHALLSDGKTIATRCVIWGGGIKAAAVAADGGLAQGRGGRVDVQGDLTLAGHDRVYVIGDIANIPEAGSGALPQLGSVALQSGHWAADNILADFKGKPRKPFHYHDKGIMAMIGRGAAIAEVGERHHGIHGQLAHMAWLGVHASLMTGTKAKIEAFVDWAWDGFSKTGGPHVLDRGDAAQIDWDQDVVLSQSAQEGEPRPSGTAA